METLGVLVEDPNKQGLKEGDGRCFIYNENFVEGAFASTYFCYTFLFLDARELLGHSMLGVLALYMISI